ncbi:MAG: DUF29 domain-containing protein [Chloroflexi bacterium]|nr:DUF29 domain-containing protein [Chloroflexota bacterium]
MTQTLYKQDFYAWTKQQAALLQSEELEKLDLPNLVEEIEAMGRSEESQLDSRLTVLSAHLLKLTYQPEKSKGGWLGTIREQRLSLKKLLRRNPTLRARLADTIPEAYMDAREEAEYDTGLPLATFPLECPWTSEQILGSEWLPE